MDVSNNQQQLDSISSCDYAYWDCLPPMLVPPSFSQELTCTRHNDVWDVFGPNLSPGLPGSSGPHPPQGPTPGSPQSEASPRFTGPQALSQAPPLSPPASPTNPLSFPQAFSLALPPGSPPPQVSLRSPSMRPSSRPASTRLPPHPTRLPSDFPRTPDSP